MDWMMLTVGLFSIAVLLIILSKRNGRSEKLTGKMVDEEEVEKLEKVYLETFDLLKKKQYFLNKSIKLSILAEELGYSDRILSKAINTHYLGNFNSFINFFRVEYSKSLLEGGQFDHYTIEAIADESGFSNKVSFYNSFKKETGMSPTEFRALKQLK